MIIQLGTLNVKARSHQEIEIMNSFLAWIIILLNLSYITASKRSQPPNICIIYADDLGWGDVSYNGSPEIPTPNIDALALNGITLQNYYGEWLCTPSRAALLTGKYPMRLGLQHSVILGAQASGLPLNETIMPQYFKKFGYETHMVGKWHLGYQSKEYTPTFRGFDSFYGYWNGMVDYFDHTYLEPFCYNLGQPLYGLDLHDGLKTVEGVQGRYATHLFTERAEDIIRKHDTSKPMFMYFAHLAAHSGNEYQQSQCPGDVVSQFKYIADLDRRIHAGVIHEMDQSVGAVFKALHEKDMLDNTIFMFIADNGAEVDPATGYGNNYPLRGNKATFWEGAIHIPAIIWSPMLNLEKPRVSHQLIHASDLLPTLYNLIGGNLDDLGDIDGFDMWPTLIEDIPSPRTELLQALDPIHGVSAYRMGDLKLVNGSTSHTYSNWYGSSGWQNLDISSLYEWVFKNGSTVKDVLEEIGMWIVEDPDEMYKDLLLTCQQPPPKEAFKCDPDLKPCLFNVTADPCEYIDIAQENSDVVNEIWKAILRYQSEEMKPQNKPCDKSGNPMCHHFQWVPWLDPEMYRECDFLDRDNSVESN